MLYDQPLWFSYGSTCTRDESASILGCGGSVFRDAGA